MRRFTRVFAAGLAVSALVLCRAWGQAVSTSPSPPPQASVSNTPAIAPSPGSIHVQSPLVVAPATVMDSSGNFVGNLHQEQFQVWDDGVAQQITYFNAATEPVAAVVLVQTGKEVAPMLPEIRPLGILLSELLLGNSGEAAVVTYADQSDVLRNFSSNQESLAAALHAIKVNGKGARLNDALERAIVMLSNQPRERRRVVIVFSQGFDRGSVTSAAEVVRAASTANVTIYGIRFDPAGTELRADGRSTLQQTFGACPASVGNRAHPCNFAINFAPLAVLAAKTGSKELRSNLLGQYAGYSGGIVYTHWRDRAVQDQIQNIALAINGQYDLAYVPSTRTNTGFHSLKITVSAPGLRVRTRAGYFYVPPRN